MCELTNSDLLESGFNGMLIEFYKNDPIYSNVSTPEDEGVLAGGAGVLSGGVGGATDASPKTKINADTVAAGVNLLATVISVSGRSDAKKNIQSVCGKLGLFPSAAKKAAYWACAKKLQEQALMPSQLSKTTPEEEKKFLGMPKAVGITVLVSGILLVGGLTTFLIIKSRKQ